MKDHSKHIRYFLFSQYLADGIRITLEIILTVIICAQLGHINIGYTIALGALCVSISDIPGPVEQKRNGMIYCSGFVFIMAILTGLVNDNMLLLGLLIVFAAFFFTMISIYGARAASIGTAALLVMILRMADVVPLVNVFTDSLLILAGGIWYMLIALLFFRFTPYRPAQRSLGECVHETARFLKIKAALYEPDTDFESEYRKLVAQQVVVNEKQDAVREILYKNRELIKESTRYGRVLILAFADLMDLYEQVTVTWYDYELLRKRFAGSGILKEVSGIIVNLANELDEIGLAMQSNSPYSKQYELIPALDKLKTRIDNLKDGPENILVLKKILVNLRSLGEKTDELINYFRSSKQVQRKIYSQDEYAKFVSHQQINIPLFRNNLHLESAVFRHALRMTITSFTGFLLAYVLSFGNHSYWILLTIIVILKPGFGLTKQRNFERLIGTVAGGVLGILILSFVHNRDVLFGFIAFFMLGTYTFQRVNYTTMVIFTTPYVIILFHLLGLASVSVAQERLLDTGIACVLAFLANYFLFPHWESKHLQTYMVNVLKANINYLYKLKEVMVGRKMSDLDYKLVRKQLYLSTANLAAAFHRMLSEPKSKQKNSKQIYQFVVLNHVLSSNVASLAAGIETDGVTNYPRELLLQINRAVMNLEGTMVKLDPLSIENRFNANQVIQTNACITEIHLTEQVDFIYKVTVDIEKVVKEIVTV